MRLQKDDKKVQVKIVESQRDLREKVDNKPNPSFGKMVYETVETLDVYEASGEEVLKVIEDALNAKSKK